MGRLTAAMPASVCAKRQARKALIPVAGGAGAEFVCGFTMLELLVAMLVVSVGVLGVAGLAALNLQHSRAAAAHSEAVLLAQDLLERIRANPAGLAAGAYGGNAGAPASLNCAVSVCAPNQTAAFDLAAWRCALGAGGEEADCAARMNGQGTVAADAASGTLRVTISWRLGGAAQTLAVASRS